MAKGRSPWQDGRRAWERLNGWHQDGPSAVPGHPDDGASSLTALADIGLVRRLLDQAELGAVRTARGHGKSWTEIATRLGITRQSAWERWHDLDDSTSPAATADEVLTRAVSETVARALDRGANEVGVEFVIVPNVLGLAWDAARERLREARLVAVGPDIDGPPLAAIGPDGIVVEQKPSAGTSLEPGSLVTLWISRGPGDAGVREPRRPKPPSRSAAAEHDDDAVTGAEV